MDHFQRRYEEEYDIPGDLSDEAWLEMYRPNLSISRASLEFTDEEIKLFQRRYEEGYDIPGDSRYEAWLEMCHPDVSVSRELFPQSMQSPHEMDAEETVIKTTAML